MDSRGDEGRDGDDAREGGVVMTEGRVEKEAAGLSGAAHACDVLANGLVVVVVAAAAGSSVLTVVLMLLLLLLLR